MPTKIETPPAAPPAPPAPAAPPAPPAPPAPAAPPATPPADPPPPGEAGAAVVPPVPAPPPPVPAAPEKYELILPKDGAVDASDLATIEALAREHNLPNDAAQALLEQHNAMLIDQSTRLAAELTADKDYGGQALPETQRLAKTVIDLVRPDGHPRRAAFQRILDKSGYGNHVEIASFLADLGKRMKEDSPISGAGGAGDTKPLANRMYPNQK